MKLFYIFIILMLISLNLFSQNKENNKVNIPSKSDTLNAISNSPVKATLTYSTLSQFIQATVTTGNNGGFNFKSSIFGLKYLFSGNNKDSLSGYYLTHKADRNQEISLGVNKVSKNTEQLSTITFGYKYALINNRDKSKVNFYKIYKDLKDGIDFADQSADITNIIYSTEIANKLLKASFNNDELNRTLKAASKLELEKLKIPTSTKLTTNDFETIIRIKAKVIISNEDMLKLRKKFNDELDKINELNTEFKNNDQKNTTKEYIRYKVIADSIVNKKYGYTYSELNKNLQNQYDLYAKKIDMGSLLTFGINPGYNIQHNHPDTSSITVRYLQGLGNNYRKPWDIDLQGIVVSLQDSSITPQNFTHNKYKLIAGIHKVFAVDDKDNPLLESEFAGEYNNVFSGRYFHERKEVVTLNLVISIHLSKEFALPITLKYDIKHPSLFGFLSIQWNLEDSGNNKK